MPAEPEPRLPSQGSPSIRKCRFNPWLFFGVLVIPAILSFAALAAGWGKKDYGMGMLTLLVSSSTIAGLICGIHFARSQTQLSVGLRVVIGIVAVIGCAGVAAALGFGGCLLVATLQRPTF